MIIAVVAAGAGAIDVLNNNQITLNKMMVGCLFSSSSCSPSRY